MHDPTETLPPTAVHVEPYTVYNVAGAMEAQGPALSFGSTSTFLHQSSHNTPDDVAFSYGASTISLSESQESAPTYPPPQSISSHSRGKSSSSGRRKKSTMGGTPSVVLPARFILHTDAEEVVELPPQYSERLASSKPPRPSEEDSSTPSAGTYPLPPPRGPSLHTPSTPIPSPGILEEEDQALMRSCRYLCRLDHRRRGVASVRSGMCTIRQHRVFGL
ncbi:hypothetical protein B0H21DRAFT_534231 [Amylocystis lapponica]|nr:hypothetical protein B0H21DRAFT_534231 [Amylocystis lapponica]